MDGHDDERVSTIIEVPEPHEPERGERQPSPLINDEKPELSPSEIKRFFQAVEEGSIRQLEELFESKSNANPNMTQFAESLLMAAIRNQQNDIAEYLIDQLAINVQHTADMVEIRASNAVPIRYQMYNCRELAYQRGMMDLVDLIDLASENVTPAIKRHLQGRLRARLDRIHQTYSERWKTRHKLQNRSFRLKETVSSTDFNDDRHTRSFVLPNSQRSFQSHIAKILQTVSPTTRDKSIDESGKKTFRFSNYTLRFQLNDAIHEKRSSNKPLSRTKSTAPALPTVSLASSSLPTFSTSFVSPQRTRLPIRETRTSICRAAGRHATFSIPPTENKLTTAVRNQSILPQRMKPNNIRQHYHPSRFFMPAASKPATTTAVTRDKDDFYNVVIL